VTAKFAMQLFKIAIVFLVLFNTSAGFAAPQGFHWLTPAGIASHRFDSLRQPGVKIQRIGVIGSDALIFTIQLEDDAPKDEKDFKKYYSIWTAYSVHGADPPEMLTSGYQAKYIGWFNFSSAATPDLAISYLTCNECEATLVLTAFHHASEHGWSAFWLKNYSGTLDSNAVLNYDDIDFTDYAEPYDQVVALLRNDSGTTMVATWLHTGANDAGEVQDEVHVYSATSAGESTTEELKGDAALQMKQRICTSRRLVPDVTAGYDSESCREIRRSISAK